MNQGPENRNTPVVSGYRYPQPGTHPPHHHPPYVSSINRSPRFPLIRIPQTVSESTGPTFGSERCDPKGFDLTRRHRGEPLGERIIVSGRVLDEDGRPVSRTLLEIWQANAAGRYLHDHDQHDAPLDPNFAGSGHTLTNESGWYKFITIRPGEYPWRNHYNAWRPAHIHFSLFGSAFATRLITQMYFPGDPLLPYDPVYNSIVGEESRKRLISAVDWEITLPEYAIGYRFDIILRGREQTPMERQG